MALGNVKFQTPAVTDELVNEIALPWSLCMVTFHPMGHGGGDKRQLSSSKHVNDHNFMFARLCTVTITAAGGKVKQVFASKLECRGSCAIRSDKRLQRKQFVRTELFGDP